MDNAITGLSVLFQRGVGPSHILLLQEIRVHNSPVRGAQPIGHQKELHLCWQTRSGARQQEAKRVSSQKVVYCSWINRYQWQVQLPNIVQLHEQWLTHKPFNEFICTLAEIFPFYVLPPIFFKTLPQLSPCSPVHFGWTHIPNLTPPWKSPCLCSTKGGQEKRDHRPAWNSEPPQSPSAMEQFSFCLWESSRCQAGSNSW